MIMPQRSAVLDAPLGADSKNEWTDAGNDVVIIAGKIQAAQSREYLKEISTTCQFRLVALAGLWDWPTLLATNSFECQNANVIICEDPRLTGSDLTDCRRNFGKVLYAIGAADVVFTFWSADGCEWLARIEQLLRSSVAERKQLVQGGEWHTALLRTASGPRPVLANAIAALRNAPEWKGVIRRDAFSLVTHAHSATPWGYIGPWHDQQDALTAEWLQQHRIFVNTDTAARAVDTVAADNPFHPVRDYLEGLCWDGRNRIKSWLETYVGVPASPFYAAIGARWLISAVARIFEPGAKVDHVLVLEGKQGIGKSSVFRTLAGPWFTDDLGVCELGSKDNLLQLQGVWIVEFSELEALTRSAVARVNAFISRSTDRFRRPYDRRAINAPRQCVFGGSVNRVCYLRDETGARRFWPVECGRIDLDRLDQNRDQLWAEAVQAYRSGHQWWLSAGETALQTAAELEQQRRYEGDPWDDLVLSWCTGHESVSIDEVLERCLEKARPDWTQSDKRRIARILTVAGWQRFQKRDGPERQWRYRNATRTEMIMEAGA